MAPRRRGRALSQSGGRGASSHSGGAVQRLEAEGTPRRSHRLSQQPPSRGTPAPRPSSARTAPPQQTPRRGGRSSQQQSHGQQAGVGTPSRAGGAVKALRGSPIQFVATFDGQPPREIRPRQPLPPITIRLRIAGGVGSQGRESPFDARGIIHAIATTAHMQPQAGDAEQATATAPEHHSTVRPDTEWSFVLRPGAINGSGFCRLEVVLVYVPPGSSPTDRSVRLLSLTSRPIHVHSFAPLVPG